MHPEEPIPLEEVTLAFQKAMSRAAQETARSFADTPAMRYGNRQLYAVRRLEVELCVGAKVERLERPDGPTERVTLTFDPPPEQAARLRFAVDGAVAPEALQEPGLFLLSPRVQRDGNPLEAGAATRPGDGIEIEAAVYSAEGLPLPAVPVILELARVAEGATGLDPAADRWVPVAPGRRWVPPVLTDGSGIARFRLAVPPAGPLLRVRARTLLPEASGAAVLTERRALYLSLEAGEAAGDVAWEAQFLTAEEAAALPADLIGREGSDD
jgi:hypothetical protein